MGPQEDFHKLANQNSGMGGRQTLKTQSLKERVQSQD